MPKSNLPVRQNPAALRGTGQSGQLNIGAVAASVPTLPAFNPSAISAEVVRLGEQAERILAGAQRADISDEKAAMVGTDFLKAINAQVKAVDEARKLASGDFDRMTKGLNALYTLGPAAKLAQAVEIMKEKLGGYLAKKRREAEAAAEAERARIAAEAQAQADAALEEGDTDGALDILTSAAEVQVEAAKPEVRGRGGSVLTAPRRKVGKVTSPRAFMAWLAENAKSGNSMALAMLGGVSFGQRELNQLAVALHNLRELEGGNEIPGFELTYEESIGAR